MAKQIFATDNGKVFNITLDPGYCFAMSIDVAKVMLTHISQGKPKRLPNIGELTPGKWAIVQSAYEINDYSNDEKIIEAQGLDITSSLPEQPGHNDFAAIANAITGRPGSNIFGISSEDEGHAMYWHRDDTNGIYLFLDPNSGLWQMQSVQDGKQFIQNTMMADYGDLGVYFDAYTVALS